MRSRRTKLAGLLINKNTGIVSAGLLTNKFGRFSRLGKLVNSFNIRFKNRHFKRNTIICTALSAFILISIPIGLQLRANAANLSIISDNWTTVPAENIDGLITSVSGELTLDPRDVADDWCDTTNCDETYPYRKLITINNTGAAQTNANLQLDIEHVANMKDDFSDVRFVTKDTKSGGNYSKGIELRQYVGYIYNEVAPIFIEIPNYSVGLQSFYMYYGNANPTIASSHFKQISTGSRHTCAITMDDKAYCWGEPNGTGISSLGSNVTSSPYPIAVDTTGVLAGKVIKQMSAGGDSTCVIAGAEGNSTEDKAYCWGRNLFGTLGNNATVGSNSPQAVFAFGMLAGKTIKSISTGFDHTCAIASDNKAYCWGYALNGALGIENVFDNFNEFGFNQSAYVPVAVSTTGHLADLDILSISAEGQHTCAIASDHNAYCWGRSDYGQLGSDGDFTLPEPVDTTGVLSGLNILSISNGSVHTCAVASNNKAYCWGRKTSGELGNNLISGSQPWSPVKVDDTGVLNDLDILSISTGGYHTCAVAEDFKTYCWGSNSYGQIGNNSRTNALVPVAVDTSDVLANKNIDPLNISSGGMHTCAIDQDNNPYCWGAESINNDNNLEQGRSIGNDSTLGSVVPVKVYPIDKYVAQSNVNSNPTIGSEQNINDSITNTGNLTSTIFSTTDTPLFGNVDITSSGSGTIQIKIRTDSNADMSTASAWATCNLLSDGDDIKTSSCVKFGDKYMQYQVFMTDETPVDLKITAINFPYTTDLIAPTANASGIHVQSGPGLYGRPITDHDGNGPGIGSKKPPYITWLAGIDDGAGAGIAGYCLYLGSASSPDLSVSSGELPTAESPFDSNGLCKYAVSGTTFDVSTVMDSLEQSSGTIYFAIQAFDKLYNIFSTPTILSYTVDSIPPSVDTDFIGPAGKQKSKAITINWDVNLDQDIGIFDTGSGVAGVKYCVIDVLGSPDNCSDPNTNWYGPGDEQGLINGGLDNLSDVFLANSGELTTSLANPTVNANGANIVMVAAVDNAGNVSTPSAISVTLSPDPTAPITNASKVVIKTGPTANDRVITSSVGGEVGLANAKPPYISWDEAVDDADGMGIAGYCLYLGSDPDAVPTETTSEELNAQSSPLNTHGFCPYAISGTSINIANIKNELAQKSGTIYFKVQAFDASFNFYPTPLTISYAIDGEAPSFGFPITGPSGVISTTAITIRWLTADGQSFISDNEGGSGIAGLKYCIINLTTGDHGYNCDNYEGDWFGPAGETGGIYNLTDVYPADTGQLITRADDPNVGNHNIFLVNVVALDNVGNVSEPQSVAVTISDYPASAPTALTVTPTTSAANNFGFSWGPPDSVLGSTDDIEYCWTVNEPIATDASNCHWTEKGALELPAGPYATKQNDNVFYLMAKSQAGVYDTTAVATATFNTSTPAPGPPSKLVVTDVSIRNLDDPTDSVWRLAMSWAKPTVSVNLVSSYQIWRSTDDIDYGTDPVGSTSKTNLSFTDVVPDQLTYYYKIVACDNAGSCGMPTNIASKYPTGHFTEAAKLTEGSLEVRNISTRRATIYWSTELESDSLVIFDTKAGLDPDELTEVGDSKTQTKIHSVELTNLQPGTLYHYQARWTNIDDFVGTSSELTFQTLPAPVISEVNTSNITISGGTVNFTVEHSAKMNIYYGKTESFGGATTINTSAEKSKYSIALTDLDDGTKYYFKLNGFDSDGNEYQGFVFSFTTLPRPKISNLLFQPVIGESSNTTKVSWTTNVPTSSELSYGVVGGKQIEVLQTKLVTEHELIISGLEDARDYSLIARSRDASGNLAVSDAQTFKTALDTRPPKISNIIAETSIKGSGAEARGQVVVSWTTDEPASSQVAYGQGAPGAYSNKTSEDSRLSTEHVVIISDLATSSIFQVQPLSKDKAGNEGSGANQSAIIGRGTENVFTIIFNSLRNIFGIKG